MTFVSSNEVERFAEHSHPLDATLEALIEVMRKISWQGGLAAY